MILKTTVMNSFKRLKFYFPLFFQNSSITFTKTARTPPERKTEIQTAKGRRKAGRKEGE